MQRGSAVKEDGAAQNLPAGREGEFGGHGPGCTDGPQCLLLCTSLFQSSPSVFRSLLTAWPQCSGTVLRSYISFRTTVA